MSLHVVSVVGARPEFVQVGALTRALETEGTIEHHLIHTGQHYDFDMSKSFFEEGGLPDPTHHLGVGSKPPAVQIGEMVSKLDPVLGELEPDVVMVYGDTNSTLSGALAGAKRGIEVAHVEAGLRSFNRAMPEELNRTLTDHLARYLFCPSQTAVDNLAAESISDEVHLTGDVMYEALTHSLPHPLEVEQLLQRHNLEPRRFVVATTHRAENTDHPGRLRQILLGLGDVARDELPVVMPVHPRTRARMESQVINADVVLIEPVAHREMVALVQAAALLLTDSGGLQKEAYWLQTPCVTMRNETEWVETVDNRWNTLAGADRKSILASAHDMLTDTPHVRPPLYGEGTNVSTTILRHLLTPGDVTGAEAS